MVASAQEKAELKGLFVEYRRTGDRGLRNQLVEEHRSLARFLARKYTNRGEPFQDLVQVAYVGLIYAVERFDPNRGIEFSTFATPTIEGEIKRHFRDKCWAVQASHRSKDLRQRLYGAVETLSHKLRRQPTFKELAKELGETVENTTCAYLVGRAHTPSPLTLSAEDGDALQDDATLSMTDNGYELAECRVVVENLLAVLSARDRQIVELRFFKETAQSSIGSEIGVAQAQVSRILTRVLEQFREQLESADFNLSPSS